MALFHRHDPIEFDMPAYASRQWVLENSGLAHRILVKTPDWAIVPLPASQRGTTFTHATYLVDCDHEDICQCSDNDDVRWMFVEFFNINEEPLSSTGIF